MRWQRLLLAPALLPALIGCRTTVTERLAPPPPSTVHHASAARSWNVIEGSAVLGRVILFEAANTPQGAVYMVQNAWSQDLGLIDSLGRAWRYRPHEPEAQWVATGTVADGAARILGIDSACTLEEVSLVDIPSGP